MDIDLKNISKIEGHTHLSIKFRDGKVIESKLKIAQNKRFFTQAITGMMYNLVPNTMSRICGTCSSAHMLCSIEAIEKSFDLNPTEQTMKLRNLLIYSGHIRDHAMHLFFFVLPDIFNKDSVLDFKDDLHQWVHDGLDVKEAGNYLSTIIGGRAVHPPNMIIGGFTKFPTQEEIDESLKKLENSRDKILKIVDLLYKDRTTFKRKTNYVALVNEDYSYLKGIIKTAQGTVIPEEQYGDHLQKVIIPYSTATGFKWESEDFMVGALARMNLNREHLNPRTKKDVQQYLDIFPNDCIFNNNLSQAIEMLHEVDQSMAILKDLKATLKPEKPIVPTPKKSVGIGVVEAPRGTLYYYLDLDEKGIVTKCDLCIPTQQNVIHLEKDIAKYVEQLVKENKNKKEISILVEKMIRAYDPCMSCATHFLKIDWL